MQAILNIQTSAILTQEEYNVELLLAETRANAGSKLRFHLVYPLWKDAEKNPPEVGTEVFGFNEKWIDEDFNPDGVRVCWRDDDYVWTSACWCNTMDSWQTLSSDSENKEYAPYNDNSADAPTHWMDKPLPPKKR